MASLNSPNLRHGTLEFRDAEGGEVAQTVTFLLEFAASVGTGLIAAWLYGKLNSRASTLRIDANPGVEDRDSAQPNSSV